MLLTRDFPPGANSSDTLIGGQHFPVATLKQWNYTLYSSNGTLSNDSWCLLAFEPYTPTGLLENGTFLNPTWCYSPVRSLGERGAIGVGLAVAFGLALLLTLTNLTKHGKTYLPIEARFRPIGRRWQWYWGSIVCATALVSLLTNVDVDRYYLPELPIVLMAFFWFLMQMSTMAAVWEMVRHWGSWMERQACDPNPFAYRLDDRRAQTEFWLPLFFYLWFWLDFFMIVPRNWGNIELQRYPEQTQDEAAPTATDIRFKVASFCLFVCWLVTLYSLRHSVKHYSGRRGLDALRTVPPRFLVILPLALCIPAYQALCAWEFAWSPLNVHGSNAAVAAGGFGPALLIVLTNAFSGFARPNEDRALEAQRRTRGDAVDAELGIVHKPAWWRRVAHGAPAEGMRQRLERNVRELGGGAPTARHLGDAVISRGASRGADEGGGGGESYEMDAMRARRVRHVSSHHDVQPGDFAGARALATRYGAETTAGPEAPPPYAAALSRDGTRRPGAGSDRSSSVPTIDSLQAPPPQVRSMLDV